MSRRTTQASIERILRAGSKHGLTATAATVQPDGSTTIHFGAIPVSVTDNPEDDWKDI